MSDLENKISHNAKRLDVLEGDVSNIRVEMGKVMVTMEHESKSHVERYNNLSTQSLELKELMKARSVREEERDRKAEEYRLKREQIEAQEAADRKKWIQGLLTPQTIILIIAIFISLMGSRAVDVMEIAEAVGTPISKPKTVIAE